jgi:alkyl hydroperoxide reductase subunit AhpC
MIDKPAPDFEADAYIDGRIGKVTLAEYRGRWVVLVFYPEDFSSVCPTELVAFAEEAKDFAKINVSIIAASTDTISSHTAWLSSNSKLKAIKYPVLSDRNGTVASKYGVFNEKTGDARRGLFVIDPTGTIKYIAITDDLVGRSTRETYRIIMALQTGELCGANWQPGDQTIKKL